MSKIGASHRSTVIFLATIVILAAALLSIAPEERTLGTGIRSVYLHVSLIWTGIAGFLAAGILGLGLVIFANERVQAWTQTIGWVACGFFGAGIAMSTIASKVNWGAVFLAEPRTVASLRVLAVAIIVQILGSWPISTRIKGLLHAAIALLFFWSNATTPLLLHPRNPIRTSDSAAIQLSFVALFGLFSLAAAWIVIATRNRQGDTNPGQ